MVIAESFCLTENMSNSDHVKIGVIPDHHVSRLSAGIHLPSWSYIPCLKVKCNLNKMPVAIRDLISTA